MSGLQVEIQGILPLRRQLQLLTMSAGKRRQLLNKVAQQVRKDSLKRVGAQTDLHGVRFAPRKKPRRRKMLSKLARGMSIVSNDSSKAKIGFRSPRSGTIAAKHQFGFTEQVSARARTGRGSGNAVSGRMASKKQAQALRDLGYQARTQGGDRRPVSWLWITSNLTSGQAGAIIRSMRIKAGQHKTSWQTKLPARSFLGATDQEMTGYINTVFNTILQGIPNGTR